MFKYACGSTTGAGAAAGAATGAEPHELQPAGAASQAVAQPLSQHAFDLHLKILESKPPPSFLEPHPLSQAGAAHGSHALISAPQVGAQPDPQGAAISAPQDGPHGSQLISAPQLGAQALFAFNAVSLHFSLPFMPLRASRIGVRTVQQLVGAQAVSTPQLGPQGAAISAPQLGPVPHPDPQGAAISAPQLGAAPLPQGAISAPHDGSQTVVSQQELEAPQPFPPSRRLKRSPPKL
ncbi:MAG: hypothetical protein LW870_16295 [Pirellula sp.]|nr:hypothetical protein [Pirellula sp.]